MSTSTQNSPRDCQHPPASRYWDTDEYRCRRCTASLSFPPHPATPGDTLELRRDIRAEAGEKRREYKPVQVVQVVQVEEVVQVVQVEEVEEVVQPVQVLKRWSRWSPPNCCRVAVAKGSYQRKPFMRTILQEQPSGFSGGINAELVSRSHCG